MTEVTWQDTLVQAHPQFLSGPGTEFSLSPTAVTIPLRRWSNQQTLITSPNKKQTEKAKPKQISYLKVHFPVIIHWWKCLLRVLYKKEQRNTCAELMVLKAFHEWSTNNFTLQYLYIDKQWGDEKRERHQLGDFILMNYPILRTNFKRNVRRSVRRINIFKLGIKS